MLGFVRFEPILLVQMWSVEVVIGFALEFYFSLSLVDFKPRIVSIKDQLRLYLAAGENPAFEHWQFSFLGCSDRVSLCGDLMMCGVLGAKLRRAVRAGVWIRVFQAAFLVLLLSAMPDKAEASYADCPAHTDPLDPLVLNFTLDECTLESGIGPTTLDDDWILIQDQGSGSSLTNFDINNGPNDPGNVLSYSVTNGTDTINVASPGIQTIDCTTTCTITGSYGASSINFTYLDTGTGGAVTPPTTPPTFSQSFSPGTIVANGTSTVTFTINNTANGTDADSLDFTDNLPSGVTVASPSNASTVCTGGTLTATSGSGVISYSGGTAAAGATCTVSVDVTSASDGSYVNTTGDLTSTLGNSGTSSATLTVASPEINVQGNGVSIVSGDTTPSAADDTEFGSVSVSSGTNANTFTIQNTGNGALTLTSVTSSDNTQFAVSGTTAGSISSLGSVTFTVTFDPSATGSQTATITIVSSDADESPYTFTVQGTGIAPEIDVQGNGVSIASGDTSPSAADDTDFGSVAVASGSVANTFTIENTGTDTLTLTSVTSSDNTQFAISGTTSGSIASLGSSTFTVTFDPNAGGTQTATITIVSDDIDEGSYTFSVQGTGIAPEINVQGNGTSIVSGDTTPSSADDTDFGNVSVASGSNANTFTIQNTGTDTLTLTSVTSSDNTQFAVTGTTSGSIAALGSSTFTVTFDPNALGTQTSTITIVSDDPDEGTYTFTVQGTGVAPEINVQGNGTSIASGDTTPSAADDTDFGSVSVSSGTNANVFTIQNTGTDALTLTSVTSSDNTQFAVTGTTSGSIAALGSATFTVTFDPNALGTQTSTITIVSNDADEGTYTFTVQGTGTSTPSFTQSFSPATILAGGTSTVSFVINNSANAVAATSLDFTDNLPAGLTVASPANASTTCTGGTITATNGSGVISYTGGTVAAGGSCSLSADVTGSTDGSFTNTTGDLISSLGNSGTSSSTLTVATPEIDVQRPAGNSIADNGTDAQGTVNVGDQQTLVYTIENTGTATLTLTGTPTGASASNVSVDSISAPGLTTLAGGASTTFTVLYTPSAIGNFSFELDILSDDADEPTYDILVSGTAIGSPEIEVSSSTGNTVSDGGTDTVPGIVMPGTTSTITYTITNTGSAVLNLTTPTVGANVTGTSNVTVNSFTLSSNTVSSGGGTATLAVSYTPTAPGAFGFDFNFANDDADENPFNVSVSGTASGAAAALSVVSGSGQSSEVGTRFEAVLVARATDASNNAAAGVSVTFTAPAGGASLTFASTGTNTETVTTAADGTATSSVMTANAIASSYNGGGALTPYSVTASSTGLSSVSFSLTNDRDASADIQKTKEVIASFVTNRANAIVSGQPDIVSRLTSGPFGRQRGRNGFNFDVTPTSQSGNFQFSLRAFANSLRQGGGNGNSATIAEAATGVRAANAEPERYAVFDKFTSSGTMSYTSVGPQVMQDDTLAILSGTNGDAPSGGEGGAEWQSGWDFWAQGTYAITDNNSSNSKTGLFFAGVDYRYKDRAVLGLLGQLDLTEERNGAADTSADGVGWMAGPYAVLRVHQNFYLDGMATYGQSYNSVNALGLFEDDFRTQRFLLQGGLTGDFKLNETTRVSPFARITYYYEEQESYTDTLGRLIPSQDFDLGRLEFGPKVSWDLQLNELLFSPFLSLSGIYDFNKLQDDTPTDATLASSDEDLRARVEAGAGLLVPGRNIQISGKGFFDGIGTSDFRSYGATLNVTIPF